jgi:hypothetical protein
MWLNRLHYFGNEIAALLPQTTIPEHQYRMSVTNLLTEVRGKAITVQLVLEKRIDVE